MALGAPIPYSCKRVPNFGKLGVGAILNISESNHPSLYLQVNSLESVDSKYWRNNILQQNHQPSKLIHEVLIAHKHPELQHAKGI